MTAVGRGAVEVYVPIPRRGMLQRREVLAPRPGMPTERPVAVGITAAVVRAPVISRPNSRRVTVTSDLAAIAAHGLGHARGHR
jgi:hypothetical protein